MKVGAVDLRDRVDLVVIYLTGGRFKSERMKQNFFHRMSRLTIVALWTYSWHLQIISLFLAQSDAIMRAKHGPVGHLAIGHVELAPYIALLVSICASSGARAQITLRNIHPIGLLLFQAEFHVETGTHFCVNCAHRVKIPVVLFLAYCGLSAI